MSLTRDCEFGMRVLEVMRQPLEVKVVTISRARGTLTFPARGGHEPLPLRLLWVYRESVHLLEQHHHRYQFCSLQQPHHPDRCWIASISTSRFRVLIMRSSATVG